MGLLRRLANRLDPDRSEMRSQSVSWRGILGGNFDAPDGGLVTPQIAETVSAFHACVNAISSALASLPVNVYRRTSEGREIDQAHPLMELIESGPNEKQTWPEFIEFYVADCLRYGNAVAEIKTTNGQVIGLKPVPWRNVTPVLLPSGRLAFDAALNNDLVGATGKTMRLLASEVVHLADRSDDGILGKARLNRCPSAIRTALNQSAFGESLYKNQAAPSGLLSFKDQLTPEKMTKARDTIGERWGGLINAGKVAIVDREATFTAINQTPEHLEMNEAQRYAGEEIYRIFAVPPPIVGDYRNNTFTNAAQAGLWFGQHCLTP